MARRLKARCAGAIASISGINAAGCGVLAGIGGRGKRMPINSRRWTAWWNALSDLLQDLVRRLEDFRVDDPQIAIAVIDQPIPGLTMQAGMSVGQDDLEWRV